jgi:hypothetical protein
VLAQNDVVWNPGWDRILREEKRYDLITQPRGDQMMAFRIEAVRKIGLFDERFYTLHFQETDYFYRAILLHPKGVSINDDHSSRGGKWNPFEHALIQPTFTGIFEDNQIHTARSSRELGNWLLNKWRINPNLETHDLCGQCAHFRRRSWFPREINWYPFFWKEAEACTAHFLREYDTPPITFLTVGRRIRNVLRRCWPLKNS